jgi:hypothetical protein
MPNGALRMIPSPQHHKLPYTLTPTIPVHCTDVSHTDLAVRYLGVFFHESRTNRSSCEAEIKSADEATRVTQHLCHVLSDLEMHGTNTPTPVFNDNQGCIDWSKSTSIKNIHHINMRENAVRKVVQHWEINLKHHPGIRNPADLFTKEHKDKSHFTDLRECLVASFKIILRKSSVFPHPHFSSFFRALTVEASDPYKFRFSRVSTPSRIFSPCALIGPLLGYSTRCTTPTSIS